MLVVSNATWLIVNSSLERTTSNTDEMNSTKSHLCVEIDNESEKDSNDISSEQECANDSPSSNCSDVCFRKFYRK